MKTLFPLDLGNIHIARWKGEKPYLRITVRNGKNCHADYIEGKDLERLGRNITKALETYKSNQK